MKLKSFLLMALAASTTLAACDKSEDSGANPDQKPKSVTVTLPNIDQTRATGDAMGANQAALANFKIFFLDAGGNVQNVPQYNNQAQRVYFDAENLPTSAEVEETGTGKKYTYHFLPPATTKVVVLGNVDNVEYATAIEKVYDVMNDGDTGITTTTDGKHPLYPLYGEANLTPKAGEDEDAHENVYEATVTMAPQIARFEVYGFTYTKTDAQTYSFKNLKLKKIALGNYSTKYNLATGAAQDAVAGPKEATEIWDYIDNAPAPWANELSSTVGQGAKVFVNGTSIPDGNTDGTGATDIVTYGLKPATGKTPELLLAFYGANDGQQDMPLYLRGQFSHVTFEPGKIYRVLFPIKEGSWTQPERCVELTVKVANWEIVTVTPTFN